MYKILQHKNLYDKIILKIRIIYFCILCKFHTWNVELLNAIIVPAEGTGTMDPV